MSKEELEFNYLNKQFVLKSGVFNFGQVKIVAVEHGWLVLDTKPRIRVSPSEVERSILGGA